MRLAVHRHATVTVDLLEQQLIDIEFAVTGKKKACR